MICTTYTILDISTCQSWTWEKDLSPVIKPSSIGPYELKSQGAETREEGTLCPKVTNPSILITCHLLLLGPKCGLQCWEWLPRDQCHVALSKGVGSPGQQGQQVQEG